MATVNSAVFLNTMNFGASLTYNLTFNNPINTNSPVGVSVMTGYVCDASTDGEKVKVGNTQLGTIGNHDINSGTCGGPMGSFVYSNNTLTGLSDDGNNLSMTAADALSDVKTKVSNNATSFTMDFVTASSGNNTNAIWAVFITYGYPNALPVQLTSFTGVAVDHVNRLDWTTVTETNCNYFDVERSNDGNHFSSIGNVQGAGNSTSSNNYTFNDENPFPGVNYYRLKQMDYDGNYQYSSVINLINENLYTVNAIDVYSLQGQLISSVKTTDENYVVRNLAPGAYLLNLHTSKGMIVKKVMCREGQDPLAMN